jgi:hypothetical protein
MRPHDIVRCYARESSLQEISELLFGLMDEGKIEATKGSLLRIADEPKKDKS